MINNNSINKLSYLSLSVAFILLFNLLSSCHRNKTKIESNIQLSSLEKRDSLKELRSFVIACGSGCSLVYNEIGIKKEKTFNEVEFKVEMYIDEVVSETYKDVYIFTYDDSGKLIRINKKGSDKNLLEEESKIRDNLKKYAKTIYIEDNNKLEHELIEDADLRVFFNKCLEISVPLHFSYEFLVEEKNFIELPKELYTRFKLGYGSDYKIARLPIIENRFNPLLLKVSQDSGQSEIYLFIYDEKFLFLDNKLIYSVEEVDGEGSIVTSFLINKNFEIDVIKTSLINVEKFQKKVLGSDKYKITEKGKFKKIE